MNFPDLVFAFALGVFSALFMRQVVIAAWRFSAPKGKPDPVDENVIRIQKWKERRQKTDKTFGRRA